MQSNARVFCSQREKAALALIVTNEEHSIALLLSEISRFMAWKTKKLGSRTFIYDHQRKRSVLSIKVKNEDADDIVFEMTCKSVVSRLNVVFLI